MGFVSVRVVQSDTKILTYHSAAVLLDSGSSFHFSCSPKRICGWTKFCTRDGCCSRFDLR